MKTLRDAAGLLIVILLVLSVRVTPTSGEGTDLIPTAHAATPAVAGWIDASDAVANEPASDGPRIGQIESLRCAPSIVTLNDAEGAERLVIVRVEADVESTDVQPEVGVEVRKPRACEIG